jgi:hypothetical protein
MYTLMSIYTNIPSTHKYTQVGSPVTAPGRQQQRRVAGGLCCGVHVMDQRCKAAVWYERLSSHMWVRTHAYSHAFMHVCAAMMKLSCWISAIFIVVRTCLLVCMYTVHICTYMFVCVRVHVCTPMTFAGLQPPLDTQEYVHMCMHVFTYIMVYIHAYNMLM